MYHSREHRVLSWAMYRSFLWKTSRSSKDIQKHWLMYIKHNYLMCMMLHVWTFLNDHIAGTSYIFCISSM